MNFIFVVTVVNFCLKKKYLFLALALVLLLPRVSWAEELVDADGDGLTDQQESAVYFTDPAKADTDSDGYSDGQEIDSGFSPRFGDKKKLIEVDSDKDYLNDA